MRTLFEKMLQDNRVPAFIKRTRVWWILGWAGSVVASLLVNLAPSEWNSPALALLAAGCGLAYSAGFAWCALIVIRENLRTGVTLRGRYIPRNSPGPFALWDYECEPCVRAQEPGRFRWEVLKFSMTALLATGVHLLLSLFVFLLNPGLLYRWGFLVPVGGW
jgi:hypothetical protein